MFWEDTYKIDKFVLTSGCASPCTIQTSIASSPSPEYTTGDSSIISGGSNKIKKRTRNKVKKEIFYRFVKGKIVVASFQFTERINILSLDAVQTLCLCLR